MPPQKVDTELPAHATGAAEKLVNERQEEKDLKLYAGWFCPFVQRTWLTLEELNIPYQYIEINPYHKSPEFLALNPRGLVPALGIPRKVGGGDDGSKAHKELKPLYESNVLNEYLNDTYAKGDNSLYPSDTYEKARMKIWIDHIGSKICPAFYRVLQHTPESNYSIEDARSQLKKAILDFIKEADSNGPFWNGSSISLIDLTLAPWNERLFLIEHYKLGGVGLPFHGNYGSREPDQEQMDGEDKEAWKRWMEWSKAIMERDSVKATLSDREMYLASYKRYAENTTGSEVGQATRSGGKLP